MMLTQQHKPLFIAKIAPQDQTAWLSLRHKCIAREEMEHKTLNAAKGNTLISYGH